MSRYLFGTILATLTLLLTSFTMAPQAQADCVDEGGKCIPGLNSCEYTEQHLTGATLCDIGQKCCAPGGVGCINSITKTEGINSAIGCIPVSDINETARFFLGWGAGIAGGVALLLIVYASYIIIMSSGDPKKMQAGKELLTAAIAGLLFLIFGVFALRIVGVEVLGIPGL